VAALLTHMRILSAGGESAPQLAAERFAGQPWSKKNPPSFSIGKKRRVNRQLLMTKSICQAQNAPRRNPWSLARPKKRRIDADGPSTVF